MVATERVAVTGRIEIDGVAPVVSCGTHPAKAVTGEIVPVSATVWREGHEAVSATLVVRYLGPAYPQPGQHPAAAGKVKPQLSATGMKSDGGIDPRRGCSQRSSASKPATLPSSRRTIG